MMESLLGPFGPSVVLVVGAAAVVGGFLSFRRWQRGEIKEIVSAAFTGRAEADVHFRAEMLASYKTVVAEAMREHESRERTYIDGLRDKIVEYHAQSLSAIDQAKRLSVHVSGEYQGLRAQIDLLSKRIEALEREVAELTRRTAA